MKSYTQNKRGFTLVEMALVLVVIGIVIGIGAGMIGPLMSLSKTRETKEFLGSTVESVNSWAASSNSLPNTAGFASVAKSPNDAWGRNFIYLFDNSLYAAAPTKDTICGRKTTAISIINNGVSPAATITNVAYLIVSLGDDAQINTTATDGPITTSRAASGTITLDLNVSDIVRWVTLDELRSKIGCQGAQLRIVNNELPYGAVPNAYSVKIYADGGVPFATNPNTYKWCVNTLPVGFSSPTGGIQNANCLNANEATWGATTASSELTISFAANAVGLVSGSYQITVVARDNADGVTTSNACSNVNSGDNCAQKVFVLTINPQ
jgi:prepilin-type N-terminal cleavage/methylation domain-containing protein